MHEYLVYGHGASWYADTMSWCYESDHIFLSGSARDIDSYRRLRQCYSFSGLSGRAVLPSSLADMQYNTKAKLLPRPGSDFPLKQVLMAPLYSYKSLPILVTKSYLPPGIYVSVPIILMCFEGLIDSSPADFCPSIAELF